MKKTKAPIFVDELLGTHPRATAPQPPPPKSEPASAYDFASRTFQDPLWLRLWHRLPDTAQTLLTRTYHFAESRLPAPGRRLLHTVSHVASERLEQLETRLKPWIERWA